MSNRFNLLSLSQPEDKHPRSWICVQGAGLPLTIDRLRKEITSDRRWTNYSLYAYIARALGCSLNTIANKFTPTSRFYPIPVLHEMLKLSKQKEFYENEIKNSIDAVKVNSASAKPVKAVHGLTSELALIVGAFMADGSLSAQISFETPYKADVQKISSTLIGVGVKFSSGTSSSRRRSYVSVQINPHNRVTLNDALHGDLRSYAMQTHYSIELTDEYADNVRAFVKWMNNVFGISPYLLSKKKGAWRAAFSNKIVARYLMLFFDASPGPKTFTANEPAVIVAAELEIRKSFARGVLMFDGCVTKHSTVALSVKSEHYVLPFKIFGRETALSTVCRTTSGVVNGLYFR